MRKVLTLLLLSLHFFSASGKCSACSTILLKRDSLLLLGHNLDESTDFDGFLCVNKRNVYKTGCTWNELIASKEGFSPSFCWISKYGSVTFSSIGRDLPDAGINEAGLAIEEMSLGGQAYPSRDFRPRLFQMQWTQYHLDSFSTVEQVIRSASHVVPNGWSWHYFVADGSGNCAVIEYIDGKLAVHTGKQLPVTVLCNSTYESELKRLRRYEGFGGRKRFSVTDKRISRFVRAAQMLREYDAATHGPAVDYCFRILENMGSDLTRRSYVVDIKNRVVYFRTRSHPEVRHFLIDSFDFSCASPVRILGLNVKHSGDVTDRFRDYTVEANRRIAASWVRHAQEMHPDRTAEQHLAGGTSDSQIERYATYPESSIARCDSTTSETDHRISPLFWAAYFGELDTVKCLVAAGADVAGKTEMGSDALMAAAQTGQLEVAGYLMRHGANIDAADKHGNGALAVALTFGQSAVAAELIRAGADVNARNTHGLAPLHWAAYHGDVDLVKLLLANGANIDAVTKHGFTALMAASQSGRLDTVEYLIHKGTNVNAIDSAGNSALLLSVMFGQSEVAKYLVKAGADVNITNNQGTTALRLASNNKHKEIVRLLKKAGAKGAKSSLLNIFR